MIQGVSEITSTSLNSLSEPLNLMVMGKLLVHKSVTPESFEKGVNSIHVSGKVVCPQSLVPVLQSKAKEVNGKIESYPDDHILQKGGLRMDLDYLGSLVENSKLAIMGDLSIDKDISMNVLQRKLSSLFVKGKLSVFSSCAESVGQVLHQDSPHNIEVIPNEYEIVEEFIRVENSDVELWENKRLYFLEGVEFDKDVEPDLLDVNLLEMKAKEVVYCHLPLKKILAKKCDALKTRIIGYKENLFLNQGQLGLSNSQLEYINGSLTLVNDGVVQIDSEVSGETLVGSIDKVYNYGIIMGSKNQLGVLRSKASVNEGQMVESGDAGGSDKDVSNAGVLRI